jgi:endonuclease G
MTTNLKRALVCALLALAASAAFAGFESCPQFFPPGVKPAISASAPGRQREICFDSFAVLHSGQSKTPVFVVERLNRMSLQAARKETRTNRFYEEARLPFVERSTLQDYKSRAADGRRFDRGHMAPAGDMPDDNSMAQSFSLGNMVPQAPQNNRKAWASIEKATRKYVLRASADVYVFTGPVYAAPVQTLGPGQVWIPKYLFKLVYDPGTGRSWAHWLENTDEARVTRPISYEELVRLTGTEFLARSQASAPAPQGWGARAAHATQHF